MNRIELYKVLSTSNIDDGQNLLESTRYYQRGMEFVELLDKLNSKGIAFTIISGYKGSVFDTDNEFKECIIELDKAKDKDMVNNIITTTFKDLFDVFIEDKIVSIQLRV